MIAFLTLFLLVPLASSLQIKFTPKKPPRRISPLQDNSVGKNQILTLEREVLESTNAKLDLKRINDVFFEQDIGSIETQKIALASALIVSILSNLVLFDDVVISLTVGLVVFLIANRDPIEEDSVTGSIARVMGRMTLQLLQISQKSLRSILASMNNSPSKTEEEWESLTQRLADLEAENTELYLWKVRRLAVDEKIGDFSADELKSLARTHKLPVGGTKSQLLLRLMEADIVKI
jgi:SAP domain